MKCCLCNGTTDTGLPVVYKEGDRFYCVTHAQILFATGVILDRINRTAQTHVPMYELAHGPLGVADRASSWTYGSRAHRRRVS